MPTALNSSSALARRCALSIPICCSSTSSIWKPTVKHGLRLAIGSWNIIAMSLPMISRRAPGSWSSMLVAVKLHPVGGHLRRPGQKPHHRQHRHRFARPRLADNRQHLARVDRRLIPSTARNGPVRVANSTVRFFMSRRGIVVMLPLITYIDAEGLELPNGRETDISCDEAHKGSYGPGPRLLISFFFPSALSSAATASWASRGLCYIRSRYFLYISSCCDCDVCLKESSRMSLANWSTI